MREPDEELAKMLGQSALGRDLRAVDEGIRRIIVEELFDNLDEISRRYLDRLCAEAGSHALYTFITPYLEAVSSFVRDRPDVQLRADEWAPLPTSPSAGEWIRDRVTRPTATWHVFSGDLRVRTVGRRSTILAEARCGRLVTIGTDSTALERSSERPTIGTCRSCRYTTARLRRVS